MEAVKPKTKVKKSKKILHPSEFLHENFTSDASTSGRLQNLNDNISPNLPSVSSEVICANKNVETSHIKYNSNDSGFDFAEKNADFANISKTINLKSDHVSKIDISQEEINICKDTSMAVKPVVTTSIAHEFPALLKKSIYPNLETIQHCKETDGILSSQTLVKTYNDFFFNMTVKEANQGYHDFHLELLNLKDHELFEMIHKFRTERLKSAKLRAKLKSLDSRLKKKKTDLWNPVTKSVSAQGLCQDGSRTSVEHEYTIQELDTELFKEVREMLSEIEKKYITDFAFHSYSERQTQLKINQFLYDHMRTDAFHETSSVHNLSSLKKIISVLFNFQRESTNDKDFLLITRQWLTNLVSILLRNGSLVDNLFIVNHVLRCPNGIHSWACQFIQIPTPVTEKNFECTFLHYILVVLYMILEPVPDRNDFLRNIKCVTAYDSNESFTLLDSDGEEVDAFEVVRDWSADDILSLLNQIPLSKLFEQILLISSTDQVYDIRRTSEKDMLKLLAFSTAVINIFIIGLKNYSDETFVQIIEVICNLMRHTVCYVSDHWMNYMEENQSFSPGLQAEFDRFIFHVVYKIYSYPSTHPSDVASFRFRVWKFLASLPYTLVSAKMLWSLLWIFHSSDAPEDTLYSEKDVDTKLHDESIQFRFFEKLTTIDQNGVVYLLNSYEKMAVMSNRDLEFICFITQEIFEVTFVHNTLRESLYKEGKILISSLVVKNTFLISFLIKEINEREDDVASWAQKLFHEINLTKWVPESEVVKIISTWLLSETLSSPKNCLARLILMKMNWSYNEKGTLYLPLDIHREVAVLVLTAYMKYDADGNTWPVSKGLKQMLQLYLPSLHTDQCFISWAWSLIFSLKLHILDGCSPPWVELYDGYVHMDDMLDIDLDTSLHILAKAFDEKHPMGLYLTLVMTKNGHSANLLADVGLTCISTLIDSQQYAAAINLLFYTLPFFVKHSELLLAHEQFISSLCDLVIADKSWFASGVVIGVVLQKIVSMIKHQIEQTSRISIEYARPLIKLWLQILFHILTIGNKAYKSRLKNKLKKSISMEVYYLLDVLVKIAYTSHNHTRDGLLEQITSVSCAFYLTKSIEPSRDVLLSNRNASFSLMSQKALPEYPWIALFILLSETDQKFWKNIWDTVLKEMVKAEAMSPASALKQTGSLYKISCPPLEYLPIYRWALQIVETPITHPALVLLCQQFFRLYLQRVPTISSSQEIISKSIGERFFKSESASELLLKLKNSIKEAEKHYSSSVEQLSRLTDVQNCLVEDSSAKNKEQLRILNSVLLTFRAFSTWINDLNLHSSTLCLSALEPKYNIEKLRLILENKERAWFELIPVEIITEELNQNIRSFRQNIAFLHGDKISHQDNLNVGCVRIMKHLNSYETVKPLLPKELNPSVEEINDDVLTSWNGLVEMVQHDQHIIQKNAKNFMDLLCKLHQLNSNYVNWVEQEYVIKDVEIVQKKSCNKGQVGANCCSGATVFHLKIQKSEANDHIQIRSQSNRSEYNLVMDQLINLPLENICSASVHMEVCVSDLVNRIRSTKGDDATKFRNFGVSLFYLQMEVIDEIENYVINVYNSYAFNYPPSKEFFAASVDLLGKEFIEGQDDQCLDLVKNILKYPAAGRLASHLFKPNIASPTIFLDVYETVVQTVGKYNPSTIIVLLSKIDLHGWLNDCRVSFTHRKQLFQKISKALYLCGNNPHENLIPIYEIFKRHFHTVLLHLFPEHYSDAVQLLLNGIKTKKLCIDIWYETFQCFGCFLSDKSSFLDIKQMVRKFVNNQLLPPEEQIFVSNQSLNLNQVLETLEIFDKYFMDIRLSSEAIYSTCKTYIQAIGIFLTMLGHSLIGLSLSEKTISIQYLWEIIQKIFYPWIYPLEKEVCLTFPWLPEEEKNALFMFRMFTICLEYFHETLRGINCERSIISYAWNYYVETYVLHGIRTYSTIVCHTAFAGLPWCEFHPCADDIEGMCKVLQSDILESRNFLADISMKIPWLEVMTNITNTKSPDYIGKTLGMLGKLLIISGWEFSVVKTNSHQNNLKAVEGLSWHFLALEDVDELLQLYYSKSNPLNVLLKRPESCPDLYVLQFLKHVCCMMPQEQSLHLHSNQKRLLFLRRYIVSLNCCISETKKFEELKIILSVAPSLLCDIDQIILKDVLPNQQIEFALPLVREVVGFINDINDVDLRNKVVEHTVHWLKEHANSPLLLPFLKATCDCLISVENLVSIVECCIESSFKTEIQDPNESHDIWLLISSFFQVPSTVSLEFFNTCAEKNAHLSFYIYVLHYMLPRSSSTENEKKFLQYILDYVKKTDINKSSESKIILLWDKILELCLLLLHHDEFQIVRCNLLSFCATLSLNGEDRTQKGTFSAFGYGSLSSLSVNFRFLCRSMAAFIHAQIPENGPLRLELMAPDHMTASGSSDVSKKINKSPTPSSEAIKTFGALKGLYTNKPYSALQSEIDYVVKCIENPKLCFYQCRELLKELAIRNFPNKSYLHFLNYDVSKR